MYVWCVIVRTSKMYIVTHLGRGLLEDSIPVPKLTRGNEVIRMHPSVVGGLLYEVIWVLLCYSLCEFGCGLYLYDVWVWEWEFVCREVSDQF